MSFLRSLTLKSLLSFGPEGQTIEFGPLNIVIGPNASGKSNLIEAISLLRSTPIDSQDSDNSVAGRIRQGGGFENWIWKYSGASGAFLLAIDCGRDGGIRHEMVLSKDVFGFNFASEEVTRVDQDGARALLRRSSGAVAYDSLEERQVELADVDPRLSVLSQRTDPDRFPWFFGLRVQYRQIRIYRDWQFGRASVFRSPQRADLRNDRLEEDFSNLGMILSKFRKNPKVKSAIIEHLRDLYPAFTDFEVPVEGGSVQVFFTEGDFSFPATRLSDGALRYLCLLAILCDPEPPPLICIEEPELGLHPDMMHKLAQLLREASQRTQLIVTTHSDLIVSSFTDQPEVVLVCEKENDRTQVHRVSKDEIEPWLEKYRLGDMWLAGKIGGTRW